MAGEFQAAPDDRGVFWQSLDDFRDALQTKKLGEFLLERGSGAGGRDSLWFIFAPYAQHSLA